MARYHLGKDGPMKCSAQIQCPLQKKAIENGEDPNQIFHYPNKSAAMAAYSEKLERKNADTIHDSLKKFDKIYQPTSDHGVVITDVSGSVDPELVADDLITGKQVSGHIDIDELDENSFAQFGFKSRTEKEFNNEIKDFNKKLFKVKRIYGVLEAAVSLNLSKKVTAGLSDRQKAILNNFTGMSYGWINGALHSEEKFNKLPDNIPTSSTDGNKMGYFSKEELFENYKCEKGHHSYNKPNFEYQSKELLSMVTTEMDAAIERAPRQQKVVYRGAINDMITDYSHGEVDEWLTENRAVGTVIEYSGYQSASYSHEVASNFGSQAMDDDVIMYEILTSEGLPLADLSRSANEDEVLLPRNQRYVVVGLHKPIYSSDGYNVHIVQMVAVDENNNILT